jgi:DNA end-binding protein Ku
VEDSHELDLTMLDRRDFSPIGYRRYNKKTDEEVKWDDIVRGYEYEKGEYVVIGDEDLKRANPELTRELSIARFVDASEIDPLLLEKSYYAVPQKKRAKGYALLRDTLLRTKTVGVGDLAIRTRQHIALVVARKDVLVVSLLRYPDELRDPADLGEAGLLAKTRVSPAELEMAERVVEGMKAKWDPGEYKDEYSDDLMELVQAKIKAGKTHEVAAPSRTRASSAKGNVIDLMPLLKRSLERARGDGRANGDGRARAAAPAAAAPKRAKPRPRATRQRASVRAHAARRRRASA